MRGRSSRTSFAEWSARRFARSARCTRALRPSLPRRRRAAHATTKEIALPGPVVPERFGLLQALLAYLLARCGDEPSAVIPARELVENFHIPEDQLQDHLALLSLVNFGGGCYAVYAELQGDVVRVDKELYGDTFRAAPRLTPLEARAITLALEFVGPMIAAEAHNPLEKVRRKLEETFGQFELSQHPEAHVGAEEEDLVKTLSQAIRERRLVEIEYQKEGEETWTKRLVEPYVLERALPNWLVHAWDRSRDAERSFRLDRMRTAKLTKERFERREGFDPHEFRDSRLATHPLLPGRRALAGRARRRAAPRRQRAARGAHRQRGVARRRGARSARRGRRPRAGRAAARDRPPRQGAGAGARRHAHARQRSRRSASTA